MFEGSQTPDITVSFAAKWLVGSAIISRDHSLPYFT